MSSSEYRNHRLRYALALAALVTGIVSAQEEVVRHIPVDAAEAAALLRSQTGWLRVSREELTSVLAGAQPGHHRGLAPQIFQADYRAHYESRSLVGEAHWQVWYPGQQSVWWRWQPWGLALHLPVTVSGVPALAGMAGKNGLGILIPGSTPSAQPQGQTDSRPNRSGPWYPIVFRWSARLEMRGDQELASLEFPPAQSARFSVEVPADLFPTMRTAEAVPIGIEPVANRPQWLRYSWALGPRQTHIDLGFRRQRADAGLAILSGVQIAEHTVTAEGLESRYHLALSTTRERLGPVLITLPAGTEVESVQERMLGLAAEDWDQQVTAQGTHLRVHLRSGSERRAELEIACRARPVRMNQLLAFPLARVAGAASMTNLMTIRWSNGLTLESWEFGDFQPQQPPQLVEKKFWQLTLEATTPGLIPLIGLPQARITRSSAELTAKAQFQWHLGITRSRLQAEIVWQVRSGSAFSFRVGLPPGWLLEDAKMRTANQSEDQDWQIRRQGSLLIAELPNGVLGPSDTATLSLRLQTDKPQFDFSKPGDWPLPEVVPLQVARAQATWAIWLPAFAEGRQRCRLGVLFPGKAWSLRPTKSELGDVNQPTPDYTFTGPLPSKAMMRFYPLPAMYRSFIRTELNILPAADAVPKEAQARCSVQIEPICGLVRSAQVRFPGKMPNDLTWRIAAGDVEVKSVRRSGDGATSAKADFGPGTVYEWTFDKPLTAPVRLETELNWSDWPLPLPCGTAEHWWEGQLVMGEGSSNKWEVWAFPPGQTPHSGVGRAIRLPWKYGEPRLVAIRPRQLRSSAPILEGALLGVTWTGRDELVCDYWAWAYHPRHPDDAHEDLSLRLRLPPTAQLRLARLLKVEQGQLVPISEAAIVHEGDVVALPKETGRVVYHVRYVLPVSVCWAIGWFRLAGPQWEEPVLCLAERRLLRMPAQWTPLTHAEKLAYQAGTLPQQRLIDPEMAEEAELVLQAWEGASDLLSDGKSRDVSEAISGATASWVIWEMVSPSGYLGHVWVETEQAMLLAATVSFILVLVGTLAGRWLPRPWSFGLLVGLIALCVLGLIWLPEELKPVCLWPLGACVVLVVFTVGMNRAEPPLSPQPTSRTAVFAPPDAELRSGLWLAITASLLAGLAAGMSRAGETNTGNAETAAEQKVRPTVFVLHYSEGSGEQARHWVLVPEGWWQQKRQALRAATEQPRWCMTASRWIVQVPASSISPASRGDLEPARVIWQLEIELRSDTATVPLAASGLRWQQAKEIFADRLEPLEITPRGQAGELLVRLQRPGKHLLELVGQVRVQRTHQENRIVWKVPPIACTQLRAEFPPTVRRADCPTALGQCRGIFSAQQGASSLSVLEAELGPTAEVVLIWPVSDSLKPVGHLEEYHLLRASSKEGIRLQTLGWYEIKHGMVSQLRWDWPDWCDVQSVQLRSVGPGSPVSFRWQVEVNSQGRFLVIEPTRPIGGSWHLLIESAVDPIAASVWVSQWRALFVNSLVVPGSLPRLMLARPLPIESWTLRQLVWNLRLPASNSPVATMRWFACYAEDDLQISVSPNRKLKRETWDEFAKHWSIPLPKGLSSGEKPGSASTSLPSQVFRSPEPETNFRVLISPRSPELVAQQTISLTLNWFRVSATLQVELQADGSDLPLTVLCQVPGGFRVDKVVGESLAQWKQEGSNLRLWFKQRAAKTTVQVSGFLDLEGDGVRRHFRMPILRFAGFGHRHPILEVQPSAELEFQVKPSPGLKKLPEQEGKHRFELADVTRNVEVELSPMAASLEMQMASILQAEPLWWESHVECRVTRGILRSLEMEVRPWTSVPPLVISDELHYARVQPLKEGTGYQVRLEFPEAATLDDQAVRFRLVGRPVVTQNGVVMLPLLSVNPNLQVQHRLVTWPRGAEIVGADRKDRTYFLPTARHSPPVTIRLPNALDPTVSTLATGIDSWTGPAGQRFLRYASWFVHGPQATLQLAPPPGELREVRWNGQPVHWRETHAGTIEVVLPSEARFSFLQWTVAVRRQDSGAWPSLPDQFGGKFWFREWKATAALHGEATPYDSPLVLQLAENLENWIEHESNVSAPDFPKALPDLAGAVEQLLDILKRYPKTDSLVRAGQKLQQIKKKILLAAGPGAGTGQHLSASASPNRVYYLRPFLPGQPSWHAKEPGQPLVDDRAEFSDWTWLSSKLWATGLLGVAGITLLGLARSAKARRYLRRFAPEGLMLAAGYWWAFLTPVWPGSGLLVLGVIWRIRRLVRRQSTGQREDTDFILSGSAHSGTGRISSAAV